MKKIISLFVAVVFVFSLLCSCSDEKPDVYSLSVHVEGSIFGGGCTDIETNIVFDPCWITRGDNTRYNKDLATFSAFLCADVYFREKDVSKGTQNRVLVDGCSPEDYSQTALLSSLGFSDVRYVESFKARSYETDTNDSVTMTMGYSNSDSKYDLYVFSVRGCFSAGEWNSVFDMGSDSELYTEYTGEHPEWTDRNVFKGYDVAANRALDFIYDFISETCDPSRETRILVTGHSRGSAIAQIVGAKLEDAGAKVFTYAFNSSAITSDPDAGKYKTIFNIYDSEDFFSDFIRFSKEDLYRFGRSLSEDIGGSEEIRKALSVLKGEDDYVGFNSELLNEYMGIIGERFTDRESLYVTRSVSESYSDEETAAARLEELLNAVSPDKGLGLEPLVSVRDSVDSDSGDFVVTYEYCDAAVALCVGKILAYGSQAADVVKTLFAEDGTVCDLADFLISHSPEINGGHLLADSYVLTRFVK